MVYPSSPPLGTSRAAIWSLVLGFLGLCTFGAAAIAGLILGGVALEKIRASDGRLGGRGLAMTGIVVSVAGLLGGLLLGAFGAIMIPGSQVPAQPKICKGMLANISDIIEQYHKDIGHYPTEEEGGLDALLTKPGYASDAMAANWHGPYLKDVPIDPWGNPIKYLPAYTETGAPGTPLYKLWSVGADGQDGTEDDIVRGEPLPKWYEGYGR